LSGGPLTIHHHGSSVTVRPDDPAVRDVPSPSYRPAPEQPPHREPTVR
ncbi:MAG: hypothetical protein H5T76_38740, partial [Streptomyces sp.]|nr:hypothetical protein [Streptomyces sp.]